MMLDGAIHSFINPGNSMTITTATVSYSVDGKTKKVSCSKRPVKYCCGWNGLEMKIQEYLATDQTEHFLWEHEPVLRSLNCSSSYANIIWIDSDTKEAIQRSFFELARHLGIVKLGDDDQDPNWSSKVYQYLDNELPISIDGHFKPTLIIFRCSKQQKRSSEVCFRILDYFPPSGLPNKNHPSVLIASETAKHFTRYMKLRTAKLEEFISQMNQIEYPGIDVVNPQVEFLMTVAMLFFTMSAKSFCTSRLNALRTKLNQAIKAVLGVKISKGRMTPRTFKKTFLEAQRKYCKQLMRVRGTLDAKLASDVKINRRASSQVGFESTEDGNDTSRTKEIHCVTQSSEVLAVHDLLRSRRHARAFWDRAIIVSIETARKTAREYVQVYGDNYNAVVQIACINLFSLQRSFLKIAREVGLHSGNDYRVVDISFASRVYEYFDQKYGDNVLFIFYCPILRDAYDDIGLTVDFLSVHVCSSSRYPFTLIACYDKYQAGIIQQSSCDSRTFSPQKKEASSVKAPCARVNSFPLVKAFFNFRLQKTPDEDAQILLRSELLNVDLKFEESTAVYDPGEAVEQLMAASTDTREATVWARLMNQMASNSLGRKALSFLWNLARLPETTSNNTRSIDPSDNAYFIKLQLSLVGSECKKGMEDRLNVLRQYSFLRFFDDGQVTTVMIHTTVRDLARLSPCSSAKSEEHTMLLFLAEVGQISLNFDQILRLKGQIDLLEADICNRLTKIILNPKKVDPDVQRRLEEYVHESKAKMSLSTGGHCSTQVTHMNVQNLTWEVIGIKAGGNVAAGGNISVVVSPPGVTTMSNPH